jgi:hypothetical protein
MDKRMKFYQRRIAIWTFSTLPISQLTKPLSVFRVFLASPFPSDNRSPAGEVKLFTQDCGHVQKGKNYTNGGTGSHFKQRGKKNLRAFLISDHFRSHSPYS